jgi:hypothetical protein
VTVSRLAWIAFATYVAAAVGAHNLYPLSTFEMYGATPLATASRIVVIDGDTAREVERYEHWRCDVEPSPEPRACLATWPFFHMEAVDRAAVDRVRVAGPPQRGREVALVRRIWRFTEADEPAIEDCVLARCEVAP